MSTRGQCVCTHFGSVLILAFAQKCNRHSLLIVMALFSHSLCICQGHLKRRKIIRICRGHFNNKNHLSVPNISVYKCDPYLMQNVSSLMSDVYIYISFLPSPKYGVYCVYCVYCVSARVFSLFHSHLACGMQLLS